MNRIPWEPGPQVDLLHHARRLWKTVTRDCSLHAIETNILGFTRERDVAGEDIPLIWLEFLRSGVPGTLPLVFDHNVMDITSLARMYALIGRLMEGDLACAPVDERALGGWLLGRAPGTGAAVLSGAFGRGNAEAGFVLGLHHKRQGEWDKAAAIWETMIADQKSLSAAIELAKHHEHRARRPDLALDVVETMLSWNLPLDSLFRQEVDKRMARLRKKLERMAGRDRIPR